MTITEMITRKRDEIAANLKERATVVAELAELRGVDEMTPEQEARAAELLTKKSELDQARGLVEVKVAEYEAERAADEAADERSKIVVPGAPSPSEHRAPAVVKTEERTYTPQSDPRGSMFVQDVARSFLYGDDQARDRLNRHRAEERVERGAYMERAVTTANFAGLTVPQYLVDLVAPNAKAGRPFADACRKHPLPEQGMTVEISKVTTGTATAIQSSQNSAVQETNIDDTQLSIAVQTNAGQQTLSRQSIDRSTGAESIVLEDLFRAYGTTLDSTLLNQATNGLTNVATAIAYTDASPTAAELYPKLFAGSAAVEAALVDMDQADVFLTMHSRRWHWINSNLSTSWPLVGQPGVGAQQAGVNFGERYGSGFRGILPNGMPVVVDNNVTTSAGTNEDEIYVVAQSEAHLWEDPNAPVFIRAEQPSAASLGVLLVAYGYFAYTFTRRAHAQKIGGTGLILPTF